MTQGTHCEQKTLMTQDDCEVDTCSASPANGLLHKIWELWEGVGMANGIQSLDESKDNTG